MADRLPRICFVAPKALPLLAPELGIMFAGGAELQQVLIARGLAARGYPVSMVCLDYGQEDLQAFSGVTVHRAYRPDAGLPGLRFLWPKMTSLWGCLRRADADVYYQRTASMLTGLVAAHAVRNGRKFVFALAGEAKIRFARDRWLYHYGIRRADSVVVQNAQQRRSAREEFGRESVLIPNICHDVRGAPTGKPRSILWVGMIRSVKRPEIFLDLAKSLPELPFVMVGGRSDGEGSLYEAISTRAAGIPNLTFAGFVPYTEMDAYFDDAMILVNTSRSEGFPNTFLQAWVRGVPTVSFVDVGATAGGKSVGAVVVSRDEMRVTLSTLAGDVAARDALGEHAKRYVEAHHSPPRVLDRYEELFRSLMP